MVDLGRRGALSMGERWPGAPRRRVGLVLSFSHCTSFCQSLFSALRGERRKALAASAVAASSINRYMVNLSSAYSTTVQPSAITC